jgi:hypothetical protein
MPSPAVATINTKPRIHRFREMDARSARYDSGGEDYISRFFRLLRRWRAETAYSSSAPEMFTHPAFIQIVGMGDKVVPLIVAELRRQPDWILGALPQITGENPIANSDRGDLYAMAAAWIEWHHRRSR